MRFRHGMQINKPASDALRALSTQLGFPSPPDVGQPFIYLFPHLQENSSNFLPDDESIAIALKELGETMTEGAGGVSGLTDDPVNTGIPAAYTYLGQFVDHDITFTKSGLPDLTNPGRPADPTGQIVNSRSAALDLDSVYDGAVRNGNNLVLGIVDKSTSRPQVVSQDDFHDLPRRPRETDPAKAAEDREAIIPDPRNDENLIVAQLHVAFLRAHNSTVKRLGDGENFSTARQLLTQHYQWLVLNDYLKRIADPSIVDKVIANGPVHYQPDPVRPGMPLEFSVAAYRFGHSMVRSVYNHNDIFDTANFNLLFTFTALSGQIGGGEVPIEFDTLPQNWIIDWRRFLPELDGQGVLNMARPIDTLLVDPLAHLTTITGNEDSPPNNFLAQRNLLRGWQVHLPTGQAVCKALGFQPMECTEIISLSKEMNPAQATVLEKHGFETRTPLWFYILLEAFKTRKESGRTHLGPTGSTILAETFVGLCMVSENSILRDRSFTPSLGRKAGQFDLTDLLMLAEVI